MLHRPVFTALLLGLTLITPIHTSGAEPSGKNVQSINDGVLANVNGTIITEQTFSDALRLTARERFYHGVNVETMKKLLREVAEELVNSELLLQEARDQSIGTDDKAITAQISKYEQQYANSAQWQQMRDRVLPKLTAKLRRESTLKRLQASIEEGVPTPDEASVARYYKEHPDKFTTPEKVELSIILLQIDPSSPKSAWQAARDEAGQLIEKLNRGGNFAELASLHSADRSAENGGNMGFIHKGMLAEKVQQAVEQLKPGELTPPLRLLEGVAIFRLESHLDASLNPLTKVKERATALLHRKQRKEAWQLLKTRLRAANPIELNETILQRFVEQLTSTPSAPLREEQSSP